MTTLEIVLLALAGALVILLAMAVLGIGQHFQQDPRTPPSLDAVFGALQPYLLKAVLAGERAVIWSLDATDGKLKGTDKKAVADSIYALLPPSITIKGITLPLEELKLLVPQVTFEGWIKQAYDEADAFITREEDYLRAQVDTLVPSPQSKSGLG